MGVVRKALLNSDRTVPTNKCIRFDALHAKDQPGLVWALYVQRPRRVLVQRLATQKQPKKLNDMAF